MFRLLANVLNRHPCPSPRRPPQAPRPVGDPDLPEDEEALSGCGWYDSSWELRRGLKVIEHVDFENLPPEVPLQWLLGDPQ